MSRKEMTKEMDSMYRNKLEEVIRVGYLILKNGGRLVKEFPHIPGIDFSGTVIESGDKLVMPLVVFVANPKL